MTNAGVRVYGAQGGGDAQKIACGGGLDRTEWPQKIEKK